MPGQPQGPGDPAPETSTTILYLVDPAGVRYPITTVASAAGLRLAAWSGDGRRALLVANAVVPSAAVSVDLHTGTQTTIPVAGYPRFTNPDGTALLVSTEFNGNRPGTLKRVDLTGSEQLTYPTDRLGGAGQFSGGYLESPDGTQLVLGTANLGNEVLPRKDNSLVVIGNDGTILRTLPAPMPNALCRPVRWWTPTVMLTHCTKEGSSASQLWEVPLDGGSPTALTAVNSGQQDDPGFAGIDDGIAWKLPSGTYLESAGACGTMFLSRLTPDGHTTRVHIDDVSGGAFTVGVAGDTLVLRSQVGCGGSSALLRYDPSTNVSTVLLGPPVTGGAITDALLYPGRD